MTNKFEASKRVVEETRRLYDGLLSRPLPANADKQLARPPFKFIQELVKGLITDTKLLRNIFNPMDFDEKRSWTKQMKVDFVQKLIDFSANNKQPVVGCLAAKVVAGLEPNKTNELLQALARLAQNQNHHQERRPRTFTKPVGAGVGSANKPGGPPSRHGSGSVGRKGSGANVSPNDDQIRTVASQPLAAVQSKQVEDIEIKGLQRQETSEVVANKPPTAIQKQKQQPQQHNLMIVSSESDINKTNLAHLKANLRQLRTGTLDDIGQMEDSLRSKLAKFHE